MIFRFLSKLLRKHSKEEKRLAIAIKQIIGHKPFNLALYQLALSHTSASKSLQDGFKESNERLEYLGDAILGAIVADYLFKKYPFKEEGFLTEIRARIVNRESLNQLSRKMGIQDLIRYEGNPKSNFTYKSMGGDALEALVGAVYLDKGFHYCRKFVVRKIVLGHLDLDDIIENNQNYKSIIIEWAQKNNRDLKFEIVREEGSKHQRQFIAQVIIDDEPVAKGSGFSKKKAEQAAAEKTCRTLKLSSRP
ncbi:ribonuclease III [Microscilla marina]|uniref:Ribonuclease 3 n=1 Tax=Microscilla marina ATCC 23134 TaxID=313606 RepID=A1ZI45_MICM2|nr:ribonuclease III [Microscilla marina]EAY29713.1 ribonuclease III [Microscilla marina ATCC 23134]